MARRLYYIVSLHQTTTYNGKQVTDQLLYYIVSLHQTTTCRPSTCSCRALYYIVSLHQTTTAIPCLPLSYGCIISFLYIKPQLGHPHYRRAERCIISFLYIKPQHGVVACVRVVKLYYIVSLHQTTTAKAEQQ